MAKWCKCKSWILCPIALLLLVATLAVCLATSASAAEVTASGTCGAALTWALTDDGVLTISGTGDMTDFTNPTVASPVTPAPWYVYRSSISSVVLNDGVTSIGAFAFYGCDSITSVSLPDSLVSIGSNAFYGVVLIDIEFPSGLVSIGINAFRTSKFTTLDLPDTLETVGNYAFYSSALTSLDLSDSLLSIGESAFYNSILSSIEFPDCLTTIGSRSFYNSPLSSVVLPSSLTSIGDDVFYFSNISELILPDGLVSLGRVLNGTNIQSIVIPSSVSTIAYGFFGAESIVDVYLLGSVPPSFNSDGSPYHSISLQHIYVPSDSVDAYEAASGWSGYADYIVPVGFEGSFSSVDLSDFQKVYDNGDDYLIRVFGPSDFSVGIPSSNVYFSFIEGVEGLNIKESLKHFDKVFYIGDLVKGAYGWSCSASFTYTSTKSASYSGTIQFYVNFFDDNGQWITGYLGSKSSFKMASGTNTYEVSIAEHEFPENAAYASFYFATPSFYNMNVSSLTADLEFTVRSSPIIPPDIPVITDDFGGELTYFRGDAATPLSVSVTNSVNGVLSYQWYYIDTENMDQAVAIYGATGRTYTPDTRSVGTRYYGCVVTNTLGELSESAVSDYVIITVEHPPLGSGYDIYDYKDYVAGSVVSGSDKTYTITFPMDGIYTELYGGLNGSFSLLDWYTGTNIFCDLPSSALGNDEYDVRLTFFPLGSGSQYNVMKLRNVAQGIPACLVFIFEPECDFYVAQSYLTLYWYDSDMNLLGSTEYDLYEEIDILSGQVALSAAFDFKYPGSAAYFTYSIDFPCFEPEENVDFDLKIITADLVMTFSMMEDIAGGIGEVGDKVDGVGDKIDQVGGEIIDGIGETNDKLDDLINGSDASQEVVDRVDQEVGDTTSRGEELLDQLDSIPHPPAQDVIVSVDSWYQNDAEGSFNNIIQIIWQNDIVLEMLMLTCTLMLVSYVLFGKRG